MITCGLSIYHHNHHQLTTTVIHEFHCHWINNTKLAHFTNFFSLSDISWLIYFRPPIYQTHTAPHDLFSFLLIAKAIPNDIILLFVVSNLPSASREKEREINELLVKARYKQFKVSLQYFQVKFISKLIGNPSITSNYRDETVSSLVRLPDSKRIKPKPPPSSRAHLVTSHHYHNVHTGEWTGRGKYLIIINLPPKVLSAQ